MAQRRRAGPGILGGAGGLVIAGMAIAWAAAATPEAYRLNELGVQYTARGQYREAAASFREALRLDPGEPLVRRNYARLHTVVGHRWLAGGEIERAREAYRAAIQLSPEETAAHLGLGDVLIRERDPRGAAESYRRAIALDPGSPIGYGRLGEALFQQGDTSAAVAEWERALAISPNDAALRGRLAQAQREARVAAGYRSRGSQHFRVVYEGGRSEEVGRELLAILERAYADVGYELGGYPAYEVETVFYADRDFADATGVATAVGGYYHLLDGKIRVATRGLDPRDPRLRSLLYHEYTHALITAMTRGNNPPRWIHEGLAVHMEEGRAAVYRREARRLARQGKPPILDDSPYVLGSAAVEYLLERHGGTAMRLLLQRLGDGRGFPEAFREAFGVDVDAFAARLPEMLAREY